MKSNVSDKDLRKAMDLVYHLEMCAVAAVVFGLAFAVTFLVSPLFGYYVSPKAHNWIDLKLDHYPLPKIGGYRITPFFMVGLCYLVWRMSSLPLGYDRIPITLGYFLILFYILDKFTKAGMHICEKQMRK